MSPEQSRMARKALKWSLVDLADAAGINAVTAVLFEAGEAVDGGSVAAMRKAFEAQHIRFMDQGALAGGILRSRIRYVQKEPPAGSAERP